MMESKSVIFRLINLELLSTTVGIAPWAKSQNHRDRLVRDVERN
jgi:hypothetical protein